MENKISKFKEVAVFPFDNMIQFARSQDCYPIRFKIAGPNGKMVETQIVYDAKYIREANLDDDTMLLYALKEALKKLHE